MTPGFLEPGQGRKMPRSTMKFRFSLLKFHGMKKKCGEVSGKPGVRTRGFFRFLAPSGVGRRDSAGNGADFENRQDSVAEMALVDQLQGGTTGQFEVVFFLAFDNK